ncbi:hypothetical protein I5Q82_07540 [Acutalibacter muris]|jgi:hypothetical protein|uniref:Uncharacterized protein n=2 Tax=Acutalibacter muris TaxID=1796620 RepID=A0AA92LAD9_9FIRM|nr:hypothetical protein [Acutalibacter muris]ANU54542.1 hypothetical protein A4V00_11255 [Hungateiclostridiaceae bacterium KB18]QQR31508.1 hypothetical protein I5Q82_07540 [Acutalibacter muris]
MLHIEPSFNASPSLDMSLKGKYVYSPDVTHDFFGYIARSELVYSIDFWGLDAKEYLSLDRMNFSQKKIDEIAHRFSTILRAAVGFLLEQDNPPRKVIEIDNFNLGLPLPDKFSAIWTIADFNQRKRMLASPEKYLHPMVKKIRVLQWADDSKYHETTVTMGSVLTDYEDYYFAGIWLGSEIFPDVCRLGYTAQSICEICNLMYDGLEQKRIVLDTSFIMRIPDRCIKKIWCSLEWNSICLYSLRNTPADYCEMGKETRTAVLKYMYCGAGRDSVPIRYNILAMEEYSVLTLNHRGATVDNIPSNILESAYIISPVIARDERVINCSRCEFITQITRSPEFKRITEYVLENRAAPTPCTKEDIVETYKRLLSDYYDVMHEDEALKEDGEGE